MLCYWFTSNTISMLQAGILRTPGMRARFNIPEMVVHPKNMQPKKKKFFQGFKESRFLCHLMITIIILEALAPGKGIMTYLLSKLNVKLLHMRFLPPRS